MTENYVTGYPPPPYYYLEYERVFLKESSQLKEKKYEQTTAENLSNEYEKKVKDADNVNTNFRTEGKTQDVHLENVFNTTTTTTTTAAATTTTATATTNTTTTTKEENNETDYTCDIGDRDHMIEKRDDNEWKKNNKNMNAKEKDNSNVFFLDNDEEDYSMFNINEMRNEHIVEQHKKEIEKYNKENHIVMLGRPPPNVIKNCMVFGVNYDIEKKLENLDADDLLYDEKKNLKDEFIRLYKKYKDTIFELLDDIVNNRKNEQSKMKHLLKIHTNLFHILAKLRYQQTADNIINVLKVQLKRRQIAIDKMKISLLNVYQYINYVQINFAQESNVKLEKKDVQKKKERKSIQN